MIIKRMKKGLIFIKNLKILKQEQRLTIKILQVKKQMIKMEL